MPNDQPDVIATDDPAIRLRAVAIPGDIPAAIGWYADPEVLRLSQGEGVQPFDAAMIEKMFTIMASRCEVYIIEVREGEKWRPVGDASLCREAGTPIVIGNPHDRSRGIGRKVLTSLEDRARAKGWSEMVVSGVYTDNLRARRLYEGAGFAITGEKPAEDGRTQWTMSLRLAS